MNPSTEVRSLPREQAVTRLKPVRPPIVIILAAGEGTRMKSSTPKVLHEIAGRSLLGHVIEAAATIEPEHLVVVVGHGGESVNAHLEEVAPWVITVEQTERNGTGHAVRIALEFLVERGVEIGESPVVVLTGDTPLLTGASLINMLKQHVEAGAQASVLTTEFDNPFGYGRIIRSGNQVVGIVEEKDATSQQREIREINSGMYSFGGASLQEAITGLNRNQFTGRGIPDRRYRDFDLARGNCYWRYSTRFK